MLMLKVLAQQLVEKLLMLKDVLQKPLSMPPMPKVMEHKPSETSLMQKGYSPSLVD
jgi:hypothetical protein